MDLSTKFGKEIPSRNLLEKGSEKPLFYKPFLNWTGSPFPLLKQRGTKKEPKPKLLSPDIFWWGGGLPRQGVGAKKFGMSLETQGIKLFWRDNPEAPEKFEKKMFGFNSRLLETT